VNQSGLWGIKKVKAQLNASWQATQAGGDCAIQAWFFGLDTGVDKDHPDLNVQETKTFLDSGTAADGHGHGTHTAGTATAKDGNGGVVGMAPGARVYGFKVCTDGGSCPTDDIIAGVDEVTARKNANSGQDMVANMSLGGGTSTALDMAVRESVNAGVVYALAAGNGRWGICWRPADAQASSPARVGDDAINGSDGSDGDTRRMNGAITVTSSNQSDNDVNCNFGNPVTVAAPGEGILSTAPGGGTATMSGTSMATPHVAGAALLYLQSHPGASPTQVEQGIVNDLDPWSTNDNPNADGRLDAEDL
jgi:subtilisin family serine protease